jgi:hypothetical protein
MSLVFRGNGETLIVKGYTDASFDSDPDDSKSQYGYMFMVIGGAVRWRIKKQETTAQSTMKFVIELGVFLSMHDHVILYCDNMCAIANTKNPRSHSVPNTFPKDITS